MTRTTRHEYLQGVYARQAARIKPPTVNELVKKQARSIMRQLKEEGRIPARLTNKFAWSFGEQHGHVMADTRSQARALIKKELGTGKNARLPEGVEIIDVRDSQHPLG